MERDGRGRGREAVWPSLKHLQGLSPRPSYSLSLLLNPADLHNMSHALRPGPTQPVHHRAPQAVGGAAHHALGFVNTTLQLLQRKSWRPEPALHHPFPMARLFPLRIPLHLDI